MNRVCIREATESDVSAIANLHAESWRSVYRGILSDDYLDNRVSTERLTAWREKFSTAPKSMFVLLADSGTQLVGFVCVVPEEDVVFGSLIDNLHVAPLVTRQGIGRQLLSEAARRLLTDGSRSGLYLWVLEENVKARRFYQKVGGVLVDCALQPMPDGQRVVALRYHWRNPEALLVSEPPTEGRDSNSGVSLGKQIIPTGNDELNRMDKMPPADRSKTGLPIGPPVDSSPAQRLRRTPLEGRFVRLVPLDPAAHGDALFEGTHGKGKEDLWLYLWEGPFADRAKFEVYMRRAAASEDPFFFAIVDKAAGHAVGHTAYMRIEPAHRVIEVGYVLYSPQLQRTAGATEAMYLLARHAFEDLGYRRYEWKCDALNARSRRAALRLGFTFEGIFRQHLIIKGRNRDTAWFSMLNSEWPARKTAFERWLDPSNFDADGRQKVSLSALHPIAGHHSRW